MRLRCYAIVVGSTVAALATVLAAEPAPLDEAAARLVEAARADGRAYDKLAWLTDRIGHRLSGSAALDRAIAWAAEELRRDGIERVWTEEVAVPRWVRGPARARLVEPVDRPLALLALGMSVPTPTGGLTAEVVEVDGFDALRGLGEGARGKIVLFHRAMERGSDSENGYGALSKLRVDGPVEAARVGAVAALVRSLGTANFRLPHTGTLVYKDDVPKIPAAALAAEDALLISRLLAAGEKVKLELDLGCSTLPDVPSANVLGEIPGREKPEEIVVIGAHLDSWDVGSGALDDGAGCAAVLETMRLLRRLEVPPRRTIRAVLFTNEENGLRGGRDYAKRHEAEMLRHVAAIELDAGAGRPLGFGVTAGPGGAEIVTELVRALGPLGADTVRPRGGGADISPMKKHGVPQIGLTSDPTYYFDYHHTEADTLDKVERETLSLNVAALVHLTYALAERDEPLPRVEDRE